MDPCPFLRLTVANLALKLPVASMPGRSVVHPSSSPCFCKIKLAFFPTQTAVVPYIPPEGSKASAAPSGGVAASFHLSRSQLDRLAKQKRLVLKLEIYSGRRGTTCGVNSGRLLGKVSVPLDLAGAESKGCVFRNGWTPLCGSGPAQFHLAVRAEPDPRFVFEFEAEPECSPLVSQLQGSIRQPVFSCNFTFRADRNQRSRSLSGDGSGARSWLSSFGSERERPLKERKGWSVTIHDLSGSPVALASMVTPFVASPGSDRVSRSNPGAWLILRPGDGTWKPWGRLEAWRERGASDGLGYRFELIPENGGGAGIVLAESTLNLAKGGKFLVDLAGKCASPACSPQGSGDFGHGLWPYCMYRGFVMSADVEGEGVVKDKTKGPRTKKKKGEEERKGMPRVEVGVQHVTCLEDAAAYVALAAAIDLSVEACRLFSQRLRKELSQDRDSLP